MKEQRDPALTTSQAALLLQVHESSVKRWSNGGGLTPAKTAGGHRRILIEDLLAFCRTQKLEPDILFFAPHEEEVARAAFDAREQGDFSGVRELVLRFCDTESPRWLVRLIRYLDEVFGIPLARIFDAGVAGALREVGRQWQGGSRTIALEHRFTQKVLDALHGILITTEENVEAGFDGTRRPHALIACAETCHHEIGGFMARVLLLRAGWTVTYLGANVPYEEIAGIQELERARLVCLGFAPPLGAADIRRCLKVLNALRDPQAEYRLVVGGLPYMAGSEEQYGSTIPLAFATSMESFARELSGEPDTMFASRRGAVEVAA